MVTQWGDLKSNDREMKMTLLHPAQITLLLRHHAVRPRRCCLWAAFSLEAGRVWASKHSASIWMRQLPAGKPSDIIAASSGTIPADASELIRMDFHPPISSCSCTDLHSYHLLPARADLRDRERKRGISTNAEAQGCVTTTYCSLGKSAATTTLVRIRTGTVN